MSKLYRIYKMEDGRCFAYQVLCDRISLVDAEESFESVEDAQMWVLLHGQLEQIYTRSREGSSWSRAVLTS